jgi:GT2 family glycosyltransferase
MAFRKEVFERYGGFRVDLGRTGKSMISNEDTELGRRLFAAGQRLRYEPSALTYHPVEEFRLRREYFLTWWFNKGRSDVRELGNQFSRTRFLGIPLRLFRNFAIQSVRWMIAIEPSHRFVCKLKVWACAGQAFEFFQQRLDAKRKGPDRNSELRRSAEGRG